MSLLRYDAARGEWQIEESVVAMVKPLKRLRSLYGPLALQYLGFWSRPWGPFTGLRDLAEKDRLVAGAVNDAPLAEGRLTTSLYKDKDFKAAEEAITQFFFEQVPFYRAWKTYSDTHIKILSAIAKLDLTGKVSRSRVDEDEDEPSKGRRSRQPKEEDAAAQLKKLFENERIAREQLQLLETEMAEAGGGGALESFDEPEDED